jgi:hypothetical protein
LRGGPKPPPAIRRRFIKGPFCNVLLASIKLPTRGDRQPIQKVKGVIGLFQMGQDKCIAITFLGKPCQNDATVGDYCIIHAGGWDHFKANSAMLYNVYGQITTILGIVTPLVTILGAGKVFNIVRGDETRRLKLDELKDRAETLIRILDILPDDSRAEIEAMGENIIRLHEDVRLLTGHLAAVSQTTFQVVNEANE